MPEPTLLDLFTEEGKRKIKLHEEIQMIEEWVRCFNTLATIIALQQPNRIADLLAYSFIIVKASEEFEGQPWLDTMRTSDNRQQRCGATVWAQIDTSLWTIHFAQVQSKRLQLSQSIPRDTPLVAGSRNHTMGASV